jgi:hypothetical protein
MESLSDTGKLLVNTAEAGCFEELFNLNTFLVVVKPLYGFRR